jgi:hypothetical protein
VRVPGFAEDEPMSAGPAFRLELRAVRSSDIAADPVGTKILLQAF